VDKGSGTAGHPDIDLADYTTSTHDDTDVGQVDLGYHYYPHGFELRAGVVDSPGFVAPLRKTYHSDTGDPIATIVAIPERGYVVREWTGTDNDASHAIFNTVTMDADKAVTAEFSFAHKRTFTVPGVEDEISDLQDAIDLAEDGDLIVLTEGTWPWGGFYIVDKVVMITCERPKDANCIAATIVDCNSSYDPFWNWTGAGGFYFGPGSGSSVLKGITITGGRGRYGRWLDDPTYYYFREGWAWSPYYGLDAAWQLWSHGGGSIYMDQGTSPVITDCVITDSAIYGPNGVSFGLELTYNGVPGGNGGGAEGGAIYIGPRSSPTIVNCRIEDCNATGGNGGQGGMIGDFGFSGGRGGWPGYAHGGAIYCATESTPTVVDCTINNCQAIGGNGGNGGDGGQWGGYGGGWSDKGYDDYWHYDYADAPSYYRSWTTYYYYWWYRQSRNFTVNGELWKHWGYIAGPWYYSGHGGGVYCAPKSEPNFVDCTVSSNYADGGLTGIGGTSWQIGREKPELHMDIPGFGGGVYCAPDSQAAFLRCNIVNNTIEDHSKAFKRFDPNDPNSGYDPEDPNALAPHPSNPTIDVNEYQEWPYSGHGGGMYLRDTFETRIIDSNISRNDVNSGYGGGIYSSDSGLRIEQSELIANAAVKGGGLALLKGWISMTLTDVAQNFATGAGEGGGMYVYVTDAEFADSIIRDNDANWAGGGVYLIGESNTVEGGAESVFRNCLITDNTAAWNGGGISNNWNAKATFSNCTIASNHLRSATGVGGGLICAYGSSAEVINSILWSNTAPRGSQLAVTDEIGYSESSQLAVSYSDVLGGEAAAYVDPACTLIWGPDNMSLDPQFTLGYYLGATSACIDAGCDDCIDHSLVGYTTQLSGASDEPPVDMGYHYQIGEVELTVRITRGQGTVDPPPGVHRFNRGVVVELAARPSEGFRVAHWTGTDDDLHYGTTNTVRLTEDKMTVQLAFERPNVVKVADDPNAIQQAIDEAKSGDTLVVHAGQYNGNINLQGKDITLTSTNPDDPNIVARTVIDGSQSWRGFLFNSREDANTLVEGFTIINGVASGSWGGGILVDANSSPTIRNIVIRDCSAVAAGSASGNGGGIAVDANSSPYFVNVTVTNCVADGNGGGVFCAEGSLPIFYHCSFSENNAVLGGGMFCDSNSLVTVRDCNFTDNLAFVGAGTYYDSNSSGIVRDSTFIGNDAVRDGGAIALTEANSVSVVDSDILLNSAIRGGGLYSDRSYDLKVTGCAFKYNTAPVGGFDPNDPNDPNAWIVGHGGAIYCWSTSGRFSHCEIAHNIANSSGGGMHIVGQPLAPVVINCLIVNNLAGRDGGGVSVNWESRPLIQSCTFAGNASPGNFGQPGYTGFGGGLYVGYHSDCTLKDSIFWNNLGLEGQEITVGTGFLLDDPWSSTLRMSYCDVKNGRAGIRVQPDCTLVGWTPGDADFATNIQADPLFVTGVLGRYYLSQTAAGQPQTSPCVDAGSQDAYKEVANSGIHLSDYTTRTDEELDDCSMVDIGYHYPLSWMVAPCRRYDLDFDGVIDMGDIAVLALYWLQECSCEDDWCDGACAGVRGTKSRLIRTRPNGRSSLMRPVQAAQSV
jgi:hypothetical protein